MTNSSATVGVRLRVDISPDCSIGPGKIALLEQIERSGSLSEAARILKMSYRRAWLLLEDLNRTLGQAVTTASIGGVGGGGAKVTPFGRHVITAFRDIERAAAAAAGQQLEWLVQSGVTAVIEPAAPRRAVTRPLTHVAGPRATAAEPAAIAADPAGAGDDAPPSPAVKPAVSRPKRRGRAVKRP